MQEVFDFEEAIKSIEDEHNRLTKFIQEHLKENEDYGTLREGPKKCLYKSGAEKIAKLYGYSIAFDVQEKIIDLSKPMFFFAIKCTLMQGDKSYEGFGAYCSLEECTGDIQDEFFKANYAIKMAKKRALVDAVLTAACISGVFTQDLEEFKTPKANQLSEQQKNHYLVEEVNQIKEGLYRIKLTGNGEHIAPYCSGNVPTKGSKIYAEFERKKNILTIKKWEAA